MFVNNRKAFEGTSRSSQAATLFVIIMFVYLFVRLLKGFLVIYWKARKVKIHVK